LAAWKGHTKIARILLNDPRVDPSAKDQEPLKRAARNGHVDTVKVLLNDSRVDPSALHQRSLKLAAGNGHVDIVKVLLNDPRVDPTVLNERFLKNCPNIFNNLPPNIIVSCRTGDLETVKPFEFSGLTPYQLDMLLEFAKDHNQEEMYKYLEDRKIDVLVKNDIAYLREDSTFKVFYDRLWNQHITTVEMKHEIDDFIDRRNLGELQEHFDTWNQMLLKDETDRVVLPSELLAKIYRIYRDRRL
jgi:hypothetical protein